MLEIEEYDLVISNYAYTELDRELQNLYDEKIVMGSSKGYMTCNFIISFVEGGNFDTLSRNELLVLKPNINTHAEEPLTSPDNFILTW